MPLHKSRLALMPINFARQVINGLSKASIFAIAITTTLITPCYAQPDLSSQQDKLIPYQANYSASLKGLNTTITRSLTLNANKNWQLNNNASIFLGEIKEQSLFTLTNNELQPLSYDYNNGLSKKHNAHISFEPSQLNIHLKGATEHLTLNGKTFDKLSFQVQLRLDVMREGNNFREHSYQIFDRNRIKTYKVEYIGEETLSTQAGTFSAIKLKQYREGKNKHTFIWLAKDLGYLILRLERYKNNKSGDSLELTSFTQNNHKTS